MGKKNQISSAQPSPIPKNLSPKTTWVKLQKTLEAQAPRLPENGLAVAVHLSFSVLVSFIVMVSLSYPYGIVMVSLWYPGYDNDTITIP